MLPGTALTAALTIVVAATAQTATPARASLVVGASIVAADTLEGTATCAEVAGNAPVRWQHDSVYVVGNTNVDSATGDRLRAEPHRLCFETRTGGLRWVVVSSEVHDASCKAARRLLLRERVVVPWREWGLVAIDRATGAIAWRRDDVPNDFVVPDGDLLVVAGSEHGTPMLAVLAAANGALACRVDLPDWPCRVCPGPHGIAVTLRDAVRVHDRTGPLLFERPLAQVAAGVQGWFALSDTRREHVIECWSRTGEVRWQVATARSRVTPEELTLFGTAAGDLLVFECRSSTDGGFRARRLALADGTELWNCAIACGARSANWLGVEPRECSGAIVVARQGIGATFAARLDPKDGALLAQLDAATRR